MAPKQHRWLFGLLLAAYSTFCAEVLAGSDLFPFWHVWGVVVTWPLYGLHALVLLTWVYRHGPRFSTLMAAGALFGLYEAYITKMLWKPTWGALLTVADVAIVEVVVLLWWHTWFSFITPVVLAETLLTTSDTIRAALPGLVRWVYTSAWGWVGLAVLGAVVQTINSPTPLTSLASGVAGVAMLGALTLLWKRATRGRQYTLGDVLPGPRAWRVLVMLLLGYYGVLGVTIYPQHVPPLWPGQVVIWILYALAALLFWRGVRTPLPARSASLRRVPTQTVLVAAAALLLALPVVKAWAGASGWPLLLVWVGGGAFYLAAWVAAWRSTRPARAP